MSPSPLKANSFRGETVLLSGGELTR